MKLVLLGCLSLVLANETAAHRLDEYLQATRISVAVDRIDLAIDLTPGAAMVEELVAMIDLDRDGRISGEEGAAYSRRMLKDLRLQVDDRALTVRLTDVSFPTLLEIRVGLGVIRIKATAPVAPLAAGPHVFSLTNAHLPAISVYLVNALVPKDPAIQIVKQTRDELQRDYRLEFGVTLATP